MPMSTMSVKVAVFTGEGERRGDIEGEAEKKRMLNNTRNAHFLANVLSVFQMRVKVVRMI